MNTEAIHGKRILEIIITVLLIIPFAMTIISKYSDGMIEGSWDWVRFILTLALYLFLYRGKNWAKRITILVTVLSSIVSICAAFLTLPFQQFTFVLLGLSLVFGIISDQLIRSSKIAAYFEYCNRKANGEEEIVS